MNPLKCYLASFFIIAALMVCSACSDNENVGIVDGDFDSENSQGGDNDLDSMDSVELTDLVESTDFVESSDLFDKDLSESDGLDLADVEIADMADQEVFDSVEVEQEVFDSVEADQESLDGDEEFDADVEEESQKIFDPDVIRDVDAAECTFTNEQIDLEKGVRSWDVSYRSLEYIDGSPSEILIHGYAAEPLIAKSQIPGVVQAHGLGGYTKPNNAKDIAALIGTFVPAFTGPGGGPPDGEDGASSEGLPSSYNSGYRMFDTLQDPRGTWFWGHAMAAMRGLTCVEHHPSVDPERLGMTGYSAGGVVTLISSAVDDRIVAAVPLSGTGGWDVATQSANAWQHSLLTAAGLTTTSEEWLILLTNIDSSRLLQDTSTKIMMINGSTDEFFPLTAHMATFNAIAGTDKRTSIVANFDHGCYALSGVEQPVSNIEERRDLRVEGGLKLWFGHYFGIDDRFATIPQPPVVTATAVDLATYVTATVDTSGNYNVERVKYWWSNDLSLIYGSVELENKGSGTYSKLVLAPKTADTIWYVDVQYKTPEIILSQSFSISSPPVMRAGLIPIIRAVDTCIP